MDIFIKRLEEGNYTEADLASFLVSIREDDECPVGLREIGNFIGHPKRNRGLSFERAGSLLAYMFSAEHANKVERVVKVGDESCPWWLKAWLSFIVSLEVLDPDINLDEYFPKNKSYPTKLKRSVDAKLASYIELAHSVNVTEGFSSPFYIEIKKEIKNFFLIKGQNLDDKLIRDLCVCSLVLLHRRELELNEGNLAKLRLGLSSCFLHERVSTPSTGELGYSILEEHGELTVFCDLSIESILGLEGLTISIPLIRSDISSVPYFISGNIMTLKSNKISKFIPDYFPLQFIASEPFPVSSL